MKLLIGSKFMKRLLDVKLIECQIQ